MGGGRVVRWVVVGWYKIIFVSKLNAVEVVLRLGWGFDCYK